MNKKYIYVFLLSICGLANADFDPKFFDQSLCKTEESCRDPNSPCKVYCAVECGPRDRMKDDRTVFEHGVCYGKPWDRDNVFRCIRAPGYEEGSVADKNNASTGEILDESSDTDTDSDFEI